MTAKMYRVHMPSIGEGVVHIPGGEPYETDDLAEYLIGSFIRLGNKEYIYALSGGITDCSKGIKAPNRQCQGWTSIAADAVVGATEVVVDIDSGQGTDGSGNIAKDALIGGEIMIGPAGSRLTVMTRTIIGNSVLTGGGGGECTVQLGSPIHTALTEDVSVAELMQSFYYGVKTSIDGNEAVAGMATCLAADGKFLWLQVTGPNGQCIPTSDVGHANHITQAVFKSNGIIAPHDYNTAEEGKQQHAGFIMARARGDSQGLPFLMLEIAH